MKLVYGIAPSPFGQCLIALRGDKLAYPGFLEAEAVETLRGAGLREALSRNDAAAATAAERVFAGQPVETDARRTAFQQRVWAELLKIPTGETRTYSDIARTIGKSSAVRAVGTAIGRNPISYLVPCHGVVRSDGYRWGLTVKEKLLATENAPPRKSRERLNDAKRRIRFNHLYL